MRYKIMYENTIEQCSSEINFIRIIGVVKMTFETSVLTKQTL